jgi:hypothetical protein
MVMDEDVVYSIIMIMMVSSTLCHYSFSGIVSELYITRHMPVRTYTHLLMYVTEAN